MNDGIAEAERPKRKTKADRLAEVHDRAMRRFDAIWLVEQDEREMSVRDRRFARIRGAQWEGQFAFGETVDEAGQPIDTGAPRLETNRFVKASRRIKSEYRSSRKMVDFKPKGGDEKSANNLDGLFRADMNDSPGGFGAAQDTAFEEGIDGGRGGFRLRAKWEDDTDEANEYQRIVFEAVNDADISMFFDLDAKQQDKSDARFAFLLFRLSRDAFEDRYPDASPATFTDLNPLGLSYDWTRPDDITLAEYFEVEDLSVLRRTFRQTALDGVTLPEGTEPDEQTYDDAVLKADDGKLERELTDQGYTEVRSRRIKRQRVRKYLLTGAECLEGPETLPGQYIPLIPFYAERTVIEGVERAQGIIRPGIDTIRLDNLMVSSLAETAAAPADSTPIVAPEQYDANILRTWSRRKIDRPSVLPLRPIYGENGEILQAGVSGMLEAPQVSPATAALIQLTSGAVPEIMGLTDQPETVPANTSAAAIQLVNDRGDVADFLWHDNFALALTHCGRVWLSMAQELYVEPGRKMIAVDPDGKQSQVVLAEERNDDGAYRINDLASGKYDVVVDIGPATKTRQDATVRNCLGIAQVALGSGDPSMLQIGTAMLGTAILNMEGEGIQGPKAYVRKQGLAGGWVEPTEEEAAELAEQQRNTQPDPNMLVAQAQMKLAEAEEIKARTGLIAEETKRITAEANAEAARARAAQALASIDQADRAQVLREVEAATQMERDDAAEDHDRRMSAVDATMRVEQHERTMTEVPNGNGG